MTQSHGQCVCRIGLNFLIDPEQESYHVLHLHLVGAAPSDDGLLDRPRTVFRNRYITGYRGADSSTTRLSQLDRRSGIMRHENRFNGGLVRPVFFDQLLQARKNGPKPLGKLPASGIDRIKIYRNHAITPDIDDTDAGFP